MAIYESVPLLVMTPFALFMLRLAVRTTTGRLLIRNSLFGVSGYFLFDCAAIGARDALYWPIVVDVYAEAKARQEAMDKARMMAVFGQKAPEMAEKESPSDKTSKEETE